MHVTDKPVVTSTGFFYKEFFEDEINWIAGWEEFNGEKDELTSLAIASLVIGNTKRAKMFAALL